MIDPTVNTPSRRCACAAQLATMLAGDMQSALWSALDGKPIPATFLAQARLRMAELAELLDAIAYPPQPHKATAQELRVSRAAWLEGDGPGDRAAWYERRYGKRGPGIFKREGQRMVFADAVAEAQWQAELKGALDERAAEAKRAVWRKEHGE